MSFWAQIQRLSSLLSEELTCVRAGMCTGHPSVCVSSVVVRHLCHLLLRQGEREEFWTEHVLWIWPWGCLLAVCILRLAFNSPSHASAPLFPMTSLHCFSPKQSKANQ